MNSVNLVSLLAGAWGLSEFILALLKRSPAGARKRDRLSIFVIWIALLPAVPAALYSARIAAWRMPLDPFIGAGVGIALFAAGIALRAAAIITLRRFFTVDVAIHKDHQLIRSGPYQYVRHPAYTGLLLVALGWGVASNSWLGLAALTLPLFCSLLYRVHVEERALIDAFGDDYRAYSAATARLIPAIY
jgi:protein-S-isoprenylcysteine O-methyltransferase